jgi:hypothetical protein
MAEDAGNAVVGTTIYPSSGLQRIGSVAPAGDPPYRSAVIDEANGFAFFGTDTAPGQVVKVNLSTFTVTGTITLPTSESNLASAVLVPGAILFGTATTPGKVVRIDLATFTRTGALTLEPGEDTLRAAAYDPSIGNAYFLTDQTPGAVVRIHADPFERQDALVIAQGTTFAPLIDIADRSLLVGTFTTPGQLIRIDLESFSIDSTLTFEAGENIVRSGIIDAATRTAYLGCATSPGRVVRVDLDSFSRTGGLTFEAGESFPRTALLDPVGGVAYFPTDTNSGRVVRVDLASFTRVGALTLPTEEKILSGGIDLGRRQLLLGTNFNTATGRIVRVSTDQSGRIKATALEMAGPGIIESLRFYGHAATGSVRVALYDSQEPKNLLWESGAVALAGADTFTEVPIASGTPASLFLPAGSYWAAWQVNSRDSVPSFAEGAPGDGFFFPQAFGEFPGTLAAADITTTSERWTEYLTFNTNFQPPTIPELRPILAAQVAGLSTTPYGDDIQYRFTWTSDGTDPVVVRGPAFATEDYLRDGDGGVTLTAGETWTVTV